MGGRWASRVGVVTMVVAYLTIAAVGAFQRDRGFVSFGEDANGIIGPLTIEALELSVPGTARIVELTTGYPGSC